MPNVATWIVDHLGTFLILALVISVSTLWSTVKRWSRLRQRNRMGGGRRQATWPAALSTAFSGLVVAAVAWVSWNLGPAIYEHSKLLGEAAPELSFARVEDDRPSQLQDHLGDVVLVNIWATWCPPCREELGDLERLQVDLKERGLVVLQISPEPRDVISKFLAQQPMSTEHGYVDEIPWPINGFPTSFLIDRQGIVRKTILGPRSYEKFRDAVEAHL